MRTYSPPSRKPRSSTLSPWLMARFVNDMVEIDEPEVPLPLLFCVSSMVRASVPPIQSWISPSPSFSSI